MTATLLRGVRIVGSCDKPQDVLLRNGSIAAIGPPVERTDPALDVVEADGRFLGPGMWDHHVHFTQWALHRERLDLSGARSAAEAVELVADRIAGTSSSEEGIVSGAGFRAAMWPDSPSLEALDRVSGGRPVVLQSGDLHGAWLNSSALLRFGHTTDATGILREQAAFAVNVAVTREESAVPSGRAASAASAAAARGVVGIVDLEMGPGLDTWTKRIAAGLSTLRISAGIYLEHLDDAIERGMRTGDVVRGTRGLLQVGPFKIITDGSLNTRTALCHDPYPDGSAGSAGVSIYAFDELVGHLRRAADHGLRPAVHAIGDLANHLALDAFEAAGCRGSIEHAQLVDREDFVRFARLGIVAGVQPEHAMDDRDLADRLWAGRTDRAFAFESLLAAGATLRLGSDAPVAPLDPWVSMAAAVSRRRDGRAPWHPEQRIAQRAAYEASVAPPFPVGASGGGVPVGPFLSSGMRADLAITERDPLRASDEELRSMVVAGTMVAGEWTHRGI